VRGEGNTALPSVEKLNLLVHPRVRGEHLTDSQYEALHGGSSPRARGTRTPE